MLWYHPTAGTRFKALAWSFALFAMLPGRYGGAAQQEAAASVTTQELQTATKVALSDRRVRELLGPGEPTVVSAAASLDKAQAEAFLDDEKAKPPERRASVLLWNRKAGKAARALIGLPGGQILEAAPVALHDIPFVKAEVEEALELVKVDESFKRQAGVDVSRFRVAEPGSSTKEPYVAQALPLRGTQPSDPCTENRCLELIFRVENGYLPIRAHVDLTRRAVELKGSTERGTHHE